LPAAASGGKGGQAAHGTRASVRDRLQRGSAYNQANHQSSIINHHSEDWPTHRHDPLRSGSTTMELPARLRDVWHAGIGGRLSAPVVAGGKVLAASIDEHRVVALDARDGQVQWAFTAGGRVDSPPTVHGDLVLFGCADGWVYCLRLADGELAWRFRAAPENLKTVACDQVESVWPVHGSVLIQHGVAYVAAGRSSYLDGGIVLYGLEPATGKVVCQARVDSQHPTVGDATIAENDRAAWAKKIGQNATDYKTFTHPDLSDAFSMEGTTTDVLVGDGESIYMRHMRFDRNCVRQRKQSRHLFSTSSLLDHSEVHRTHWALGTGDFSRTPVAYSWIANSAGGRSGSRLAVPYGMMLVFDAREVWGVRRHKTGGYELFAQGNKPFDADEPSLPDFREPEGKDSPAPQWAVELTMRPRAMLRAGKTLVLAGMPVAADPADPLAAYKGQTGGVLWAVSTTDGSKTAEYKLESPPVWDGMAAAAGRLYVSTSDGRVTCIGERQ
jgi:outer membrane protein assembly factor BamB